VNRPSRTSAWNRLAGREHPALQHQLGQADTAQEGRLAALAGAGEQDQPLAVGLRVVADGPGVQVQGQADVVEPLAPEPGLARRHGLGEAGGLALAGQPLVQVQAADVEAQLGPEHGDKAQDVIG
jgi:hypothetical protein